MSHLGVQVGSIYHHVSLLHWCKVSGVVKKLCDWQGPRVSSWGYWQRIALWNTHAPWPAWWSFIVVERFGHKEYWYSSSIGTHSSTEVLNTKSCVNTENCRLTSCWNWSKRERINQWEICGVDTWTSKYSTEHTSTDLLWVLYFFSWNIRSSQPIVFTSRRCSDDSLEATRIWQDILHVHVTVVSSLQGISFSQLEYDCLFSWENRSYTKKSWTMAGGQIAQHAPVEVIGHDPIHPDDHGPPEHDDIDLPDEHEMTRGDRKTMMTEWMILTGSTVRWSTTSISSISSSVESTSCKRAKSTATTVWQSWWNYWTCYAACCGWKF